MKNLKYVEKCKVKEKWMKSDEFAVAVNKAGSSDIDLPTWADWNKAKEVPVKMNVLAVMKEVKELSTTKKKSLEAVDKLNADIESYRKSVAEVDRKIAGLKADVQKYMEGL